MVHKQPDASSAKLEKGITKRKRKRGRRARNKRVDRFSNLPDNVLLHIMSFMDTRDAVRTCILSKRWKNLCKCLTNLKFYCTRYGVMDRIFEKFVSWVVTGRDDSCSLLNLVVDNWVNLAVVDRLGIYAMLHGVKQLTMHVIYSNMASFDSLPLIFSSHTLTSLKLCISTYFRLMTPLLNSPHLPTLKSLHLEGFTFGARDSDRADPVSNCQVLNNLVLRHCHLGGDARVLSICNSSLSSLTIWSLFNRRGFKILLSTPNLISCTINGSPNHQLSSTCNLSFLEEVNIIDMNRLDKSSMVISWLQMFANVKLLTLTSSILQLIQEDLSNPNLMRTEPPCLSRLESLKVKRQLPRTISDEEVTRAVDHLLQNTSKDKVDIITCDGDFANDQFF